MPRADVFQRTARQSPLLAAGLAWIAIAALLTSHFRFYFGVDWYRAVKWGLGDGFVWCMFVVALGAVHRRYFSDRAWPRGMVPFAGLCVLCAVLLHPATVTLLYWTIDGALARPYFEDTAHLAMKRLPQGVLAGLVIAGGWIGAARLASTQGSSAARNAGQAPPAYPFLWLSSSGAGRRISVTDIRYVEAAENYVSIVTRDETHLERGTLTAMADKLAPYGFVRISRRHLIGLEHVLSIKSRGAKGAAVAIDGGALLPVSRQYKADLARAVADRAVT